LGGKRRESRSERKLHQIPRAFCGNSHPRGADEVWIDAESGIGGGDAGRAKGRDHRKDFVAICDKTSSPARVRYKLVLGPAQLPEGIAPPERYDNGVFSPYQG